MSAELLPFRLFDPDAEVGIVQRRLPHWSQGGTICLVTWRTCDSLPKVRSEEQLDYLRRYIAANPARARLSAGEYLHYSKSS